MGTLRSLHSSAKQSAILNNQAPDTKSRLEQLVARLLGLTKMGTIHWTVGFSGLYRFQSLGFSWETNYLGYKFYIAEREAGVIESFVVVKGELENREGTKIYRELNDNPLLIELYNTAIEKSGFEKPLKEKDLFELFRL